MNMHVLRCAVMLAWACLAWPATADADPKSEHSVRVEVFIDQSTSAFVLGARGRRLQQSGQLVIHRLDAMDQIDQRVGQGLSTSPQVASAQLKRRLEGQAAALRQQWRQALQSELRAMELGVTRLPAVVFDGATVVYGASTLEQAWTRRPSASGEVRR